MYVTSCDHYNHHSIKVGGHSLTYQLHWKETFPKVLKKKKKQLPWEALFVVQSVEMSKTLFN